MKFELKTQERGVELLQGSSQESDGRETVSEQIQPPSAEVVQLRTTVACMDAAVR